MVCMTGVMSFAEDTQTEENNRVLNCTLQEHVHGETCYEVAEENAEPVLICEITEHTHANVCYTQVSTDEGTGDNNSPVENPPAENENQYGDLQIQMNVEGSPSDAAAFAIKVTLTSSDEEELAESYEILNSAGETGSVTIDENNQFMINLKAGESVTIKSLPKDTSYKAECMETEGYLLNVSSVDGTIVTDATNVVLLQATLQSSDTKGIFDDSVSQPIVPFAGVSGVKASYTTYFDEETNVFHIEFHITKELEDAAKSEKQIVLSLSEAVLTALNTYAQANGYSFYPVLPGDANAFMITVITDKDVKGTYRYKDQSFQLRTDDITGLGDDSLNIVGSDGQLLPTERIGTIPSNSKPLTKLLNTSKLTGADLIRLPEALRDKYDGQDVSLSKYLLDYYNDLYKTSYNTFVELLKEKPSAIISANASMGNGQYKVNGKLLSELKAMYGNCVVVVGQEGDIYEIQLKWPNREISAAVYNIFYDDLYYFSFDQGKSYDEFNKDVNGTGEILNYSVNDYALGGARWTEANAFFNSLPEMYSDEKNEGSNKIEFKLLSGLSGPFVNNTYQLYDLSFYSALILEDISKEETPVDPVPPVDPPIVPVDPIPPVDPPIDPPVDPDNPQPLPPDENLEDPEEPDNPTDNPNQQLPPDEHLEEDNNVKATKSENPDQPKTGDESQLALYLLLAVGAGGTLALTVRRKRTSK